MHVKTSLFINMFICNEKLLTVSIFGGKYGLEEPMASLQSRSTKPYHFTRFGNPGFEFDPTAAEVAILDRSGRAIWKKSKGELPTPIRWTGIDATGKEVQTGDYI